jgi:Predicted hydrolases or acyltransferases (alpha/beta hydrolase superfamily)
MSQFFQYHQYRIRYAVEGRGECLVFIHGWPTNSLLWQKQVDHFKQNYRVLTFDWLGFGQSDKPIDQHFSFTEKKEILTTLLKELITPDEKVNIIAHDIGGPPAILWTYENQTQVKRLVLLNTVIYPFSTFLDRISHSLFEIPPFKQIMMSNFGLTTTMKVVLSKNRGRTQSNHIRDILNRHQDWTTALRVKTILEPLKKAKKEEFLDLSARYQAIHLNKYLIIAKADPLLYAHMKKLSKENPEVPKYIIPKSGHFISIDQPEELNKVLTKILNSPTNYSS